LKKKAKGSYIDQPKRQFIKRENPYPPANQQKNAINHERLQYFESLQMLQAVAANFSFDA